MKILIYSLFLAFMATSAYGDSSVESSIVSFINNTPFILNKDPSFLNGHCVDNSGDKVPCLSTLPPGATQYFYLSPNTRLHVHYILNNPNSQHKLSFDIFHHRNDFILSNYKDPTLNGMLSQNSGPNSITYYVSYPMNLTPSQYDPISYRGVSLSGLVFASDLGDKGSYASTPSLMDAKYFIHQGMNTIRIPISWNYLSKDVQGNHLNPIYLNNVYDTVQQYLNHGIHVILDLHAHLRFNANGKPCSASQNKGCVIGNPRLIWYQLAEKFKPLAQRFDGVDNHNQLMFQISDSPYVHAGQPSTQQVLQYMNDSIAAIRKVGLDNLILIDGNNSSELKIWMTLPGPQGETNAQVFTKENIKDPKDNYAIAVHQYFDESGLGQDAQCLSISNMEDYLNMPSFMAYVNANQLKVFLVQFASGPMSNSPKDNCKNDINQLLQILMADYYKSTTGGFLGWTAWLGGHDWNKTSPFNLQQDSQTQQEATQILEVYKHYLRSPSPIFGF